MAVQRRPRACLPGGHGSFPRSTWPRPPPSAKTHPIGTAASGSDTRACAYGHGWRTYRLTGTLLCEIITAVEYVHCPNAVMETSRRGSPEQRVRDWCEPGAEASLNIPPELLTERPQAE